MTPTSTGNFRAELEQLQRQINELRAELGRRDVEQIEVEGAVEYLLHNVHRLESVMHTIGAAAVKWLVPERYQDSAMWNLNKRGDTWMFPPYCAYHRPPRRWAPFGSVAELAAMCAEAGIEIRSRDRRHRESLIRHLWEFHLLPGSTHLFNQSPNSARRAA